MLALAGLLLLRRPQRGVLVLAALAPFDGLLLLVPHPPLADGWKEALVLATLAAAVLRPDRVAPRVRPGWLVALVGLALLGAGSAVFVGGTQALLGMKINFFYLLLLPILWRCPFTARDRDRLVTVLMVTGTITAVVGLWQQVVGGAALNDLGYAWNETIRTAGGLLRSFSTFNQPFPFGLFQMLVLLVAGVGLFERDLEVGVLDLLDDFAEQVDLDVSLLHVHDDVEVGVGAILLADHL